MCQKSPHVFKQFYAVMLTSRHLQSPKVLQVFKRTPNEHVITKLISNHVVGKADPSPHLYGDKPEVHVVPVRIPVDILYH